MTKWVYAFGGGQAEGSGSQRDLLGGKGANLAEMAHLGLPVPPGFTVTTEVCTWFYAHDRRYPDTLRADVDAALAQIGALTDRGLRRRATAAAGVGALRRPRLHAGHDGHGAEPRPQRPHRRGLGGVRQG